MCKCDFLINYEAEWFVEDVLVESFLSHIYKQIENLFKFIIIYHNWWALKISSKILLTLQSCLNCELLYLCNFEQGTLTWSLYSALDSVNCI